MNSDSANTPSFSEWIPLNRLIWFDLHFSPEDLQTLKPNFAMLLLEIAQQKYNDQGCWLNVRMAACLTYICSWNLNCIPLPWYLTAPFSTSVLTYFSLNVVEHLWRKHVMSHKWTLFILCVTPIKFRCTTLGLGLRKTSDFTFLWI